MNDTDHGEPLEPIRKVLALRRPVAMVFAVYTRDIGRWWPLLTHSLGTEHTVSCAIEGRIGGRIFERHRDGSEHVWGLVTAWEPPLRLAHSWRPSGVLEHPTRVEVSFQPIDADLTRFVLIHDGWRQCDADRHPDYIEGWDTVLRDFFVASLEGQSGRDTGPRMRAACTG